MPTKTKPDPLQGWTDPDAVPAPRAELVQTSGPDSSTSKPDIDNQDPAVFAGITADHALRVIHAQVPGAMIDTGKYLDIYNQALKDAVSYRSRLAEQQKSKQLEETFKVLEAAPGGIEEQKAQIAAKKELLETQAKEGPSATAAAAAGGNLPGGSGTTGIIKAPTPQQQKDWSAYTEGFHNLQDLHALFNSMATKTVGAGGPGQSLAGLATKLTDLTSPEARVYHAYVDSSLIPLAKSIMGDAASTAGKETVQGAMTEALPTNVDTLATGGQKMYMFYKRALDKLQTERDMARRNGTDTSSIDTALNDFHSFMDRPEVKQYNPLSSNQPLVIAGNSDQTRKTTQNVQQGAMDGTNPPVGTGQSYPTISSNPMMTMMPGTGTTQYPTITSTPGSVEQPAAGVQALINLPGQVKQALTPKPGGPEQDKTLPPFSYSGSY